MWELDHKKSECQTTDAFELWCWRRTLENLLDWNEIKPVNPKQNQPWVFIGRTDAEAEAPILWPPDVKIWLTGKDPDAGKDWRQEEGTIEDEMARWHHWLNGHEFEQAPRVGDGEGSLACCCPCCHKESDMTDWTELNWIFPLIFFVFLSVNTSLSFSFAGYFMYQSLI